MSRLKDNFTIVSTSLFWSKYRNVTFQTQINIKNRDSRETQLKLESDDWHSCWRRRHKVIGVMDRACWKWERWQGDWRQEDSEAGGASGLHLRLQLLALSRKGWNQKHICRICPLFWTANKVTYRAERAKIICLYAYMCINTHVVFT